MDFPELAPAPDEQVAKKHRYSGFFGTDLDIILREWASIRSSSLEQLQRIAAMRQRAMQCFVTGCGALFCPHPPLSTGASPIEFLPHLPLG